MESLREQVPPRSPDSREVTPGTAEREQARKQLERKRKFWGDVFAYIVINAFIVALWAFATDRDSFWPAWVMGGWGALLLLDAWNAFFRRPISEADIDAELRRRV